MTALHPLTRAILALGSNLGERAGTLQSAVGDLVDPPEVRLLNVSPVVTTKAVGGPEGQPDFLNMVIAIETALTSTELLAHCQAVELSHHRTRTVRWGARTLDVDIITYGEESSVDPVLTLPHPRAAGRAFVLYPWSLMEPNAKLSGSSVAELAAAAPDMPGISVEPDNSANQDS
ncbi:MULTISPECIES: 2-amino-4-hydroxy-6-hydroxymethyldihydropteridine diphosphokinase [Arthrobacter]|uniref:2-amino-4-hydroxy-6- hydroxymethyldihydropteridine diphosphokinase n=1 Tax=unclassified Arthrobacter TaxID=235627 RepID=UPI0024BBA1A8|nr:2-amino-4-hydroxy-6-hydroxymethyldihydropteridine diphosphokinase [Arthrobacter sp. H35-MC1]MDJ0316707.1 2-amino-4-hydroxy-6-hydroxymethyldihydropteridine diphosphokinase [Arthrobacter sp. H35-MC1]